jgi:hypothetical protein
MKKTDRIERYRTLMTGLQTVVGSNGTITVKGVATKVADIATTLQAAVDAPAKSTATETAFHEAVAAEKAANKSANAVYLGVKSWALVQYGNQPTVLAQLGLEVKQPKKPNVATKAAAAGKARQTRAKLGTKGKRQKAAAKVEATASPAPTATTGTPKSS